MPFWGMSTSGRNAQGMLNEMPRWNWDQFQQWAGRANATEPQVNALNEDYIRSLQRMQEEGFGTPESVSELGGRIAPGAQDAIARRWERLNAIRDSIGNIPGAESTVDAINQQIDELGRNIGRVQDENQGTIDTAFSDLQQRGDAASGDVIARMREAYGRTGRGFEEVYGGIRGDIGKTFGDLTAGSNQSFQEAMQRLEMLRPGGEAAAARAARAFAPEMSATMRRLRAGGVSPNSLEATSALGRVGAARSRAMDDALASASRDYVTQGNELTLGRQGARERLGLGRLGSESELMRSLAGIRGDLALGEAGDVNQETLRNLESTLGNIRGRAAGTLSNTGEAFNRTTDYLNRRSQVPLVARELGEQDWQRNADVSRELNQEETFGPQLQEWLYGLGAGHQTADLGRRDAATAGIGNLSQQLRNAMLQYSNQARGFAQDANQGFQNSYQMEQANAGWGRKLLGGLGTAALNYFLPRIPGMPGSGGGARPNVQLPTSGQPGRTPPFVPPQNNLLFQNPFRTMQRAGR